MTSNRLFIVLVLALGLAVAGCGGGGGGVATGAATDPFPRGDPIAGRDAFLLGTDPRCGDCHTLADAATTGTIGPNLDEVKPTFEQVIAALNEGPGEMPDFSGVSPQFKNNIAAYVSTAAGQGADQG
ncbi:MAG: cytochrome c [Gaiellaceae bacterium]